MLALLLACAQDTDDNAACEAIEQYVDADADGYGGNGVEVACAGAPGFSPVTGDCDDADAGVSPGADERCAEGDENCDGAEGEGAIDAATWYADVDEDGFGEDASAIVACDAPAGTVERGGDCDDGDAGLNPDAADVCWDEIDTDCDGSPGDDCVEGVRYAWDADLWLVGDPGSSFGTDLCGWGDLTGDGVADFAVTDRTAGPGTAYVFSGTLEGRLGVEAAAATLVGPDSGDAGSHPRCGDDLTGDGIADLALYSRLGAATDKDLPAVWIFDGPISGERSSGDAWGWVEPTTDGQMYPAATQGTRNGEQYFFRTRFTGEPVLTHVVTTTAPGRHDVESFPSLIEENTRGIQSAVSRCDTDADGTAEIIYGDRDAGGELRGGSVYRLEFDATSDVHLADADARLDGTRYFDDLGGSVACVGDADGDGADDVAAGGPTSFATIDHGGRIWLFTGDGLGASGEADARASLIVEGTVHSAEAGWQLGVRHDGRELWIGAPTPSEGPGRIYSVPLDLTGTVALDDGDLFAVGDRTIGLFGALFAASGDGKLVVASSTEVGWDSGYGTAYVFRDED